MSEYRHEYKYVCDVRQFAQIQGRIHPIMQLDRHAGKEQHYTIRSLYFDDYENRCFYENMDGTDSREKFRIRIYNGNSNLIRLELKQKIHGMTRKNSCVLHEELVKDMINGSVIDMRAIDAPLYRKFCLQWETRMLQPKVIVEYDRVPYICPDGNVRVTFDTNIRSSNDIAAFLDEDIQTRPIMESGYHVLEVKFDEFIPDYIHHAIQIKNLKQTTFSKYCLCRKYNMRGVI